MSTKNQKSQLAIIFMTVFIYLLGFGIVIPIIPILGRDFGASPLEAGLLMSVYSLMQFVFAPFWGKLSDKMGRRPILLFCMMCEGFSYLLFAYARDLNTLFVARALAGFFGASLSTASAYISDITTTQDRSKGMALIGAAFGLGFLFGPALGGLLSTWGQSLSTEPHFGTSFTALWVAGICFINFFFGIKFLKESLAPENRVVREHKRFSTMLNYLSKPTIGSLIVIFFLSSFAMSSMEATLILFMSDKFNWTVRDVSFGFAYIGLIMVFTQGFLVRRLIPKLGEKTVLAIGLTLFFIGLCGIAFSPSILFIAISMTSLALGTGLTNPSIMGSISILSDANEQGAVMGVTQSMASLGRIIGPALGGAIYGSIAQQGPFVNSALIVAIALILYFRIKTNIPEQGKTNV